MQLIENFNCVKHVRHVIYRLCFGGTVYPEIENSATRAGGPTSLSDAAGHDAPHQLLDVLDDLGRLISTNYRRDTMVAAIADSVRTTLNAGRCDVYLWNRERQALENPLRDKPAASCEFVPRGDRGIGCWVMRHRRLWTRARHAQETMQLLKAEGVQSPPVAVVPLTAGTAFLGVLVIDGLYPFPEETEKLLSALTNVYALGIRNAELFERIDRLARCDGLTGLYNHATFHRMLDALLRETCSRHAPLSLIMGDIDHFKRFNDDHGHQTGDLVLQNVARLWNENFPQSAVVARYGGEEFVAALPDVDELHAAKLAETLRQAIAQHRVSANGLRLQLTSSFGVAESDHFFPCADELVSRADRCLYVAKESGRNRVIHCESASV